MRAPYCLDDETLWAPHLEAKNTHRYVNRQNIEGQLTKGCPPVKSQTKYSFCPDIAVSIDEFGST